MLNRIAGILFLLAAVMGPARAAFAAPANVQDPVAAHESGAAPVETEHSHGLLEPDIASAIWTLVIFLILLAILYRTAWKNVLLGLKAREERIRGDITEAEASRGRAEVTFQEYTKQLATAQDKVREMLNKAAADAEQLGASIRARAQQEAEETRERATREIEIARDQALSEIYAQTADLATRVAEKILRRNLNADDQRDLVNQSLQELQTIPA